MVAEIISRMFAIDGSSTTRDIAETLSLDMTEFEFAEQDQFAVRLCFEEAVSNALRHGVHRSDDQQVRISWKVSSNSVELRVSDDGAGFDPETIPDPTVNGNVHRPHGRGLFLMREYADQAVYSDGGRTIELVRRRRIAS